MVAPLGAVNLEEMPCAVRDSRDNEHHFSDSGIQQSLTSRWNNYKRASCSDPSPRRIEVITRLVAVILCVVMFGVSIDTTAKDAGYTVTNIKREK